MRRLQCMFLALVALSVSACSTASPGPTVTVTTTVTETVQGTMTEPSSTTDVTSSDPTSPPDNLTDTTTETDSTPSSQPPPPSGAVGLDSFFNPSSVWTENRFNVADRGQVQGVSSPITPCADPPEMLEMRLSNNFRQLTFSVGQDNDSDSSDEVLILAVKTNGKQADVRRIKFNTVQDFRISVEDVNAVQFIFTAEGADGRCGSENIRAVLFDGKLT